MKATHLDHVELSNAVLLHAHRHGDAILLDQHGCASVGPTQCVCVCVCPEGKECKRVDAPLVRPCYPSSMFKQRGWESSLFTPERGENKRRVRKMHEECGDFPASSVTYKPKEELACLPEGLNLPGLKPTHPVCVSLLQIYYKVIH